METGNMDKFIYVFSEADRDKLLECGFILLKKDPINHTYVFVSNDSLLFSEEIRAVRSNVLTF